MSPSWSGLVGSPTIAASQLSPFAAAHSSSLAVPLIDRAFLVAGDQQRDRALEAALGCDVARGGGDEAGDAALHVDRAAAVHLALVDVGREGRMRPGRLVADRNDVGMAGEHQMRPVAGSAGIEVFDIRRAVLREDRAFDREAERLQHRLQRRERAAFGRRDRGAADERCEIFGGIGRKAHGAGIVESGPDVTGRRRHADGPARSYFGLAPAPSIIVIFCRLPISVPWPQTAVGPLTRSGLAPASPAVCRRSR